jgi:DNA-binding transcriptional MerR regulator
VFNIGEFSTITGLTVKTLRFYHEQGVLEPTSVDDQTGYRYYAEAKIETARIIKRLRELDFSLEQIKEILKDYDNDTSLLAHFERQQHAIEAKQRQYREIGSQLAEVIKHEKEVQTHMQENYQVEEKLVGAMLIAGLRMRGKYSECGKAFSQIGKQFGRYIRGKALLLHYDTEYKEEDADFEACFPIKQGAARNGVSVRELPGGKCVTLIHKGPYDELGRSYAKVIGFAKDRGYKIATPTREVYLKGPGMIFRGNPKKYLTEIQLFIEN